MFHLNPLLTLGYQKHNLSSKHISQTLSFSWASRDQTNLIGSDQHLDSYVCVLRACLVLRGFSPLQSPPISLLPNKPKIYSEGNLSFSKILEDFMVKPNFSYKKGTKCMLDDMDLDNGLSSQPTLVCFDILLCRIFDHMEHVTTMIDFIWVPVLSYLIYYPSHYDMPPNWFDLPDFLAHGHNPMLSLKSFSLMILGVEGWLWLTKSFALMIFPLLFSYRFQVAIV